VVVRFSEEDKATIWEMRQAGVPVKQIAKHLGRQNLDSPRLDDTLTSVRQRRCDQRLRTHAFGDSRTLGGATRASFRRACLSQHRRLGRLRERATQAAIEGEWRWHRVSSMGPGGRSPVDPVLRP
jgi:transposase-like protein